MTTKILYSITGFLLGVLIGSLVGLGELNQTKKSVRGQVFPFLLVIGATVGGITGASIGYKTGLSRHIENVTGISTAQTTFLKQGRFWIASTVWTDIRNNTSNQILTGKSTSGTLISELGDKPIFAHDTTSGSRVNVQKYHSQVVRAVFSKLKESFVEENEIDLQAYFPSLNKEVQQI